MDELNPCPKQKNRDMSETSTVKNYDHDYTAGILCAICGKVIPLYDYRQNVFPVCEECRKRAKKLLYSEKSK